MLTQILNKISHGIQRSRLIINVLMIKMIEIKIYINLNEKKEEKLYFRTQREILDFNHN